MAAKTWIFEDGTFWFCLKRNAAAQRRVLMASLIIPVSLLIISARGQERNPLRLRPTSLYPPPPTLPRRLSSSISLSRQLQYLLRDATSSTRLVHETTPSRIVGPIIANNNEVEKKRTMSIVYLLDRVSIGGIEGILLIFFERSHFSMIFFHIVTAAIVVLLIGTRYSNDFEPRIFPPPRMYVYIYRCWCYNGNAKRDCQSKFLRITLAFGGFSRIVLVGIFERVVAAREGEAE